MNFAGKIALITGASRGIGRAIAVEFAARGADVALVGRDTAALEASARECRNVRSGALAEIFAADVTDQSAIEKIVGDV